MDEKNPGCWGQASLTQGMTRAKNEKAARDKIEEAIGRTIDGIEKLTGYMLQHCKGNKQHYLWVD
jgi:hypothetical protein